jgi:hypothetical protein
LFVVLLVLVSVALSAGTITFVNKLDPLQKELANTKTQLAAKDTLLEKANTIAASSTASIEAARAESANELAAARKSLLDAQGVIADRDAQIAKLNNNIAVLTSANSSATTALAASEDAKSKMNEQVATLRKDADDRLRQNADLSQRVSKLVADLDQTEKARRNLAEQLTDASGRADRLGKLLQDNGITTAQLDRAGTGAGAPAINGVIRSRRNIAGKDYATISIGSQDLVAKGMKFNIIDPNSGMFLGLLEVEVVDQNEAMGQITAEPQNLAQIKAGNVVKTQI